MTVVAIRQIRKYIYVHPESVTDLLSRLNKARILERALLTIMTAKTTQIELGILATSCLVATSGTMLLIWMKVTVHTSLGHVFASLALSIDLRRLAWVPQDSVLTTRYLHPYFRAFPQ